MTNAIRLPETNRSLLHAPFQQRQESMDSCEKQSKHIAVRSTRRPTPPSVPAPVGFGREAQTGADDVAGLCLKFGPERRWR